jgi:hypothetical protein
VLPDGVTMIGQETRAPAGPNVYPLLRSTDGGASWQALPEFPAGIGGNREVLVAPDGTAFAYFPGAPGASSCTIYKLMPGANAWACSARTVENIRFVLLTWDAQGHPARVWSFVDTGSRITELWSHPA